MQVPSLWEVLSRRVDCSARNASTRRLVELLRPDEVLCDMMAGIGPFAVPAARRRVTVHANDLNPRCAHYLRLNAKLNKVRTCTPRRAEHRACV